MQVLISLAFCITTGLALAGLAGLDHWFNQPGTRAKWKLTPEETRSVQTGLMGGMVSSCCAGLWRRFVSSACMLYEFRPKNPSGGSRAETTEVELQQVATRIRAAHWALRLCHLLR